MKIYFAHCMADYDNRRELQALHAIHATFPEAAVLNPNSAATALEFQSYRQEHPDEPMAYFRKLVRDSDVVVYLPNADGSVAAGAATGVLEAFVWGKAVYRITPEWLVRRVEGLTRVLSIEETRALIKAKE